MSPHSAAPTAGIATGAPPSANLRAVEPPAADRPEPPPHAPGSRAHGDAGPLALARAGHVGVLPLVAGPASGDALADASRPVQVVASLGPWAGWAAVLVATLVPTTVSLTALRVAAPAAVAAAVAALVADGADGRPSSAWRGRWWRRWWRSPPRPPRCSWTARPTATSGACPCGPRPPCCSARSSWRGRPWRPAWRPGPLLLAARQWVAGAVAVAWAACAAWWGVRVLHTLARRWLVFVPAGLVVHDPLALRRPVLLRRARAVARAGAGRHRRRST